MTWPVCLSLPLSGEVLDTLMGTLMRLRHILADTYYFPVFILAILESAKQYLIEVLICVSLLSNDAEYLFMNLLANCVSLDVSPSNFLILKLGFVVER